MRQSTAICDHGAPASCRAQIRVGDPPRLGELVAVRRDRDLALAVGLERHEVLVGVGPLRRGQGRDDGVGGVQDAGAGPEVREQRQPRPPRPVGVAERRGKSSRL